MAEEEKKEEKFEFDAAGQSMEYISLDQARVLAMEPARDNQEFYGRRYASRELVWEVLSQEESEDYYDIRLSYRPARGFQGEPGVDQFTIDKSGPIRLRQILREPRRTRRFIIALVLIGVILAAGAATIGGLLAAGVFESSSAADSIAEAATPITVSIENRSALTFVSPDGSVTVDVSAGSVDATAELTYRQLTSADIPVLPATFQATGKAFDLATGAVLLKPIRLSIQLSASDAGFAGGDEANRVIQHYHNAAWALLDTTIDFRTSMATADVDQLSVFALTIRQPKTDQTPTLQPNVTPTQVPTATEVLSPTTIPIEKAGVEGRLLFDGSLISRFTQTRPTYLIKGRSQQQDCADVDGMPWDGITPEIDLTGSTYSLSGLTPGHYCLWVTIDASEPFDARNGRPGDYASGSGYCVEIVIEPGRIQTHDLSFYRWMRLTSPVDTASLVMLEGQPPASYRALVSPVLVPWEPIPEAVRYDVGVAVCPLAGCDFEWVPVIQASTQETSAELELAASLPGEKYWLNVSAIGRTNQPIGQAWVVGPGGSQIAFMSDRDGEGEIYVMSANGSGQTRLTNNSDNDWGPAAWSPDASPIAFSSDRDGNFEIYVMNADGSAQTRLTNNAAGDAGPVWSPDGNSIAFRSQRDGGFEIYTMSSDGSAQTRLTNDSANHHPNWSPDGERIVFFSDRDGASEIYVMNADGSVQTPLTLNPANDWGPSGRLMEAESLSCRTVMEVLRFI